MKNTRLTFFAITLNLIIAASIIVIFTEFKGLINLFSDWPFNLGIGILSLYISGNYIEKRMEFVIHEKKWNSILTGMIGLLLILIIGMFFGSTVGFLQEGIKNINRENGLKNALFDYYVKPAFWILIFGIIPTIIIGGIMGYGIKSNEGVS